MTSMLHRVLAGVAVLPLIVGAPAAFAQAQSGTTSGPASGTPATLGNNGAAPASPHQTDVLRNKGGQATEGESVGTSAPATGTQTSPACTGQNCKSQ